MITSLPVTGLPKHKFKVIYLSQKYSPGKQKGLFNLEITLALLFLKSQDNSSGKTTSLKTGSCYWF